MTAQQIAQQIRAAAQPLPGLPRVRRPAAGAADRRPHGQPELQHHDAEPEHRRALRRGRRSSRQAIAEQVPEVQDVSTDMEMKSPRIDLVDRSRQGGGHRPERDARSQNALYDGLGPKWSSTIYGARRQYRVLLELDPKYQEHADSLEKVAFKTPNGALVPLESVVDFKETVGPQSINHSGQLPSVSVSFGLQARRVARRGDGARQAGGRPLLPPTITTSFEGSAKVFQQSMSNLGLLLFIAIGVVYIVLGALYESYIHPITILSGLPSAGLGALVTLYLFGNELNIYSFVGLDHADRHREEERDHADRLRARSRAPARQVADRSDLRRLPHPLPPDHDDDDGGAARRRCRSRSATARAAKRGGRSASRSSAAWSSRSSSRST